MNNSPSVSIITIFLNAEKFIEEAIASVLSQSYDNWELLLVDDGSTDNSPDIARQYVRQYSGKVRYLEHENHQNMGMSASRNLGIKNARGELVAFLDADDVWFPQKLEQQVEIMTSQPEAAMVYGWAYWWYSWTGKPEDSQRDYCDFLENEVAQPNKLIHPPALLPVFLNTPAVPCPSAVMARRTALEAVGGFEECFRGMYEDQAFYVKFCLKNSVFVAGECWIKYRRHEGACFQSALQTGRAKEAQLFFLNWVENYLIEQDVKDKLIWMSLKKELFPFRHPVRYKFQRFFQRGLNKSHKLMRLMMNKTLFTKH